MNAIKTIRKDVLHLTLRELAEILGVSQGTVSKWENGQHGPTVEHLAKVRAYAQRSGIAWSDSWFFGDPVTGGDETCVSHETDDAAAAAAGHGNSNAATFRESPGRESQTGETP